MQDLLAVRGETAGPVRHQPLALGDANGLAEIGFAGRAEWAITAFRGIQRDDVVPGLDAGDTLANFLHHAAALVAKDGRKRAFRIVAGQGIGVRMANSGGDDTYQYLAGFRTVQVDLFNG